MFVTPAYAQTGAPGGAGFLIQVLPFVAIFAIMYFLIIRPQRTAAKKRTEMLEAIRRNDVVVTGGGVVGKVTKVKDDDPEIEVEIATGTKVRVMRAMIADVRVKGQPAESAAAKPAKTAK